MAVVSDPAVRVDVALAERAHGGVAGSRDSTSRKRVRKSLFLITRPSFSSSAKPA